MRKGNATEDVTETGSVIVIGNETEKTFLYTSGDVATAPGAPRETGSGRESGTGIGIIESTEITGIGIAKVVSFVLNYDLDRHDTKPWD